MLDFNWIEYSCEWRFTLEPGGPLMNHLQSTASVCTALPSFATITDSTMPSGPLISNSQTTPCKHGNKSWTGFDMQRVNIKKTLNLLGRGGGTPRSLKSGSANIYRGEWVINHLNTQNKALICLQGQNQKWFHIQISSFTQDIVINIKMSSCCCKDLCRAAWI